MHESRPESALSTTVRIVDRRSFIETCVFDNGSDFFSDTEVESYDAAAFYKGLIRTRTLLRRWGGLLWVEPDVDGGERFRFTLPCRTSANEYRILDASGVRVAVPLHNIEDVITPGADGITHHNGDRYIECNGRRVPVYRMDELAGVPLEDGAECDRIAVTGIAEKRIGIFVSGDGDAVDGVAAQLTESEWAGLSTRQLHMGEREYPVLDMKLVLERMDYLRQLDDVPETSGSLPMGEEVVEIDPETVVPRVLI
jgi:hypothetical protein